MDASRDLGSFPQFFTQHRSWSRALAKAMLAGTSIDWEGCWNEAWAKFSRTYVLAEVEIRDQAGTIIYMTENFLAGSTDIPAEIKSELEDAVTELKKILRRTDFEALTAVSEKTGELRRKTGSVFRTPSQARSPDKSAASLRDGAQRTSEDVVLRTEVMSGASSTGASGDATFVFTAPPERYLRTCLVNQARDALRHYLRAEGTRLVGWPEDLPEDGVSVDDLAAPGDSAVRMLDAGEQHDPALAAALSFLSPMQRAVIVTWSWMEPPPTDQELGDEFGISTSAARTHKKRALDKLREILGVSSLDVQDAGEEIS